MSNPIPLCPDCVDCIGGAAAGPDAEWRPTLPGEACMAADCATAHEQPMSDDLSGCRVPGATSGPLTDGGYRVIARTWGVDYDARGNATGVVMWPPGLSDAEFRAGARRAAERLRPDDDDY